MSEEKAGGFVMWPWPVKTVDRKVVSALAAREATVKVEKVLAVAFKNKDGGV